MAEEDKNSDDELAALFGAPLDDDDDPLADLLGEAKPSVETTPAKDAPAGPAEGVDHANATDNEVAPLEADPEEGSDDARAMEAVSSEIAADSSASDSNSNSDSDSDGGVTMKETSGQENILDRLEAANTQPAHEETMEEEEGQPVVQVEPSTPNPEVEPAERAAAIADSGRVVAEAAALEGIVVGLSEQLQLMIEQQRVLAESVMSVAERVEHLETREQPHSLPAADQVDAAAEAELREEQIRQERIMTARLALEEEQRIADQLASEREAHELHAQAIAEALERLELGEELTPEQNELLESWYQEQNQVTEGEDDLLEQTPEGLMEAPVGDASELSDEALEENYDALASPSFVAEVEEYSPEDEEDDGLSHPAGMDDPILDGVSLTSSVDDAAEEYGLEEDDEEIDLESFLAGNDGQDLTMLGEITEEDYEEELSERDMGAYATPEATEYLPAESEYATEGAAANEPGFEAYSPFDALEGEDEEFNDEGGELAVVDGMPLAPLDDHEAEYDPSYSTEMASEDGSGGSYAHKEYGASHAAEAYEEDGYVSSGPGEGAYDAAAYSEEGYSEEAYSEEAYSEEGYSEEAYSEEGYSEEVYKQASYDDVEEAPAAAAAYAEDDVDFSPAVVIDAMAVDLLYAVGIADTQADVVQSQVAALANMREQAQQGSGKGRRGGRVKLEELPLNSIEKGNPLIITVTSPKGGVGKSTTSVNLGAYIAAVAQKMAGKGGGHVPRVCVLDGDVANGNLAIRITGRLEPNMLNLIEDVNPVDLVDYEAPAGMNSPAMIDYVMRNEALPNLNVLAAPENPEVFYDFSEQDYADIINMLGRFYDVIIIDSGTEVVMESNRYWLRAAHLVYLLTMPELATLHSAGKYARYVVQEHQDAEGNIRSPLIDTTGKLNIVMMRSDADFGIDPEWAMEKTFPWATGDHCHFFPDFDREAARANNREEFLVMENQDYAKQIGALAKSAFSQYIAMRRIAAGAVKVVGKR